MSQDKYKNNKFKDIWNGEQLKLIIKPYEKNTKCVLKCISFLYWIKNIFNKMIKEISNLLIHIIKTNR